MIRKSGDASSTHMMLDECMKLRAIVLANTSTTSIASMTLMSAMTAVSSARSHCGTPGG